MSRDEAIAIWERVSADESWVNPHAHIEDLITAGEGLLAALSRLSRERDINDRAGAYQALELRKAAEEVARLSRALAERDALLTTGSACEIGAQNPNVASYIDHWEFRATTAEKTLDEIRDWRATVTAALGREGGAHYPDVPRHISEMRRALDGLPGHTCHVSSDTCGGCEYAMERDKRLAIALRERDEARAALAEQAKHDCDEWLSEGMGCALCNDAAIALRETWANDPVRKERDELRAALARYEANDRRINRGRP